MRQKVDAYSYKCKKCDSPHVVMQQAGLKTGLYCQECHAWIKWLSKDEINALYRRLKDETGGQGKAFRSFRRRRDGSTIIKCSACKCQLHNSLAPEPLGQYDLKNAKYCPQCGAELV